MARCWCGMSSRGATQRHCMHLTSLSRQSMSSLAALSRTNHHDTMNDLNTFGQAGQTWGDCAVGCDAVARAYQAAKHWAGRCHVLQGCPADVTCVHMVDVINSKVITLIRWRGAFFIRCAGCGAESGLYVRMYVRMYVCM